MTTMTTQKWRAVAFVTCRVLEALRAEKSETALMYARLAFSILERCGCCERHAGSFPLSPETTERTPTASTEQCDTDRIVCGCMCRQTARQISSAIVNGIEASYLEQQLSMVVEDCCCVAGEIEASSMGLFYETPRLTWSSTGCSRCECTDCPFCLDEDAEDTMCACPCSEGNAGDEGNIPVLDQRFQAVGETVEISPEVVREIHQIDTSLVPSKTAHQTLEDVMGTPAFCTDTGERIVTRATNCEPLCYWWTDCNKRCLACLKTGMARGDIPVSQEVVLFLLEE